VSQPLSGPHHRQHDLGPQHRGQVLSCWRQYGGRHQNLGCCSQVPSVWVSLLELPHLGSPLTVFLQQDCSLVVLTVCAFINAIALVLAKSSKSSEWLASCHQHQPLRILWSFSCSTSVLLNERWGNHVSSSNQHQCGVTCSDEQQTSH
jgi:hypothetical protein